MAVVTQVNQEKPSIGPNFGAFFQKIVIKLIIWNIPYRHIR